MYTQPHIHDIRERCVINSELMSEEEFIDIVNTILNLGLNLSYFEKTTLISFEYFKRKKVEYAVIEVGV
jgi:dihydrofolate synthase/folylpolyglutamate synthase